MWRIKHPEHGAMHVYTPQELERHQELGWAIEEPEKIEPIKEQPATLAPEIKDNGVVKNSFKRN